MQNKDQEKSKEVNLFMAAAEMAKKGFDAIEAAIKKNPRFFKSTEQVAYSPEGMVLSDFVLYSDGRFMITMNRIDLTVSLGTANSVILDRNKSICYYPDMLMSLYHENRDLYDANSPLVNSKR
jgi:hypothetical protein